MLELNFRKSLVLAVVGSMGIALGVCASAPARTRATYDGRWWLAASKEEQSGFLNGYIDCYIYEYRGRAKFTINPPDVARGLVTGFYARNSSRLGKPVWSVFYSLRDRPGEKSTATGGKPIRGRHGFYRGLYWNDLYEGNTDGQLGFVEGYLECHSHLNHDKGGTFSKSHISYVALVNRWYGFDPRDDAALERREDVPIADVLFKFRDQAQRSATAHK